MASELVNKLPQSIGRFSGNFVSLFYKNRFNVTKDDFSLTTVGENDIMKIVQSIGANKATGLDNLPAQFLKDSIDVIVSPLTHLVNLSIYHGIVPNELKSARVVPLY